VVPQGRTGKPFKASAESVRIVYSSGSQPRCREEVSGVPPNIEFTTFFSFFTTKGVPNCHFSLCKGAAKLFSVSQGAVNQKRLKNTGLQDKYNIMCLKLERHSWTLLQT
jgi:hypothetical protein